MTSFTFGGISYHSRRDMLTAIALDWLTAGGLNDEPRGRMRGDRRRADGVRR